MKVRDTSPGRLYALSSEIGCTAINGAMAVDIPAGGQVVILALDKKIVIDGDDAAKFIEVRWGTNTVVGSRPVPAWLSDVLSGLISIVGDDNFDINYIPAENKLIVHTDRVDAAQLEAVTDMLKRFVPKDLEVVQYNHHIELTYEEYMKYSKCKTIRDMEAINPEYYNDVTETGVFAYNLDSLQVFSNYSAEKGWYSGLQKSDKVKKVIMDLPSYPAYSGNNSASLFQEMPNLEEIEFSCKGLEGHSYAKFANKCPKLRRIKARIPGAASIDSFVTNAENLTHENIEITQLDSAGYAPSVFSGCDSLETWTIPLSKVYDLSWAFRDGLRSFEVELPSLNSGYDAFTHAQLDKESVVRICNSIPADPVGTAAAGTSGKGYRPGALTLGIHIDLQNDEEVWGAIHNAEARGWKLTVKWNPGGPTYVTPEATTFGLRGQLIYAKVGEGRDGERVLDWGHYVTDWEARGYEEFRSLESAYEYFGLEQEV